MTFEEAVELVTKATTAEAMVGPDDDGRSGRVKDLIKILHPDRQTSPPRRKRATTATAKLTAALAAEKRRTDVTMQITTPKRVYDLSGLAFSGRMANLYRASYVRDGKPKTGLMKMPRSPRDSDLMVAEAKSLKPLWADETEPRRMFVPKLEESFRHRDAASKVERQVNVLRWFEGFVSLAEVQKAYPNGLDPRDLAWMWRRIYVPLSFAHEHGIVHGAVVPEHILVHPELHGLILVGWGSSVEAGQTVKLISGPRDLYAPEILSKAPVSSATDLYMATRSMGSLLRRDAPLQFRAFINGTCFDRPKSRPQDARVLLAEYDELIERLFGTRTFRPFAMPTPAGV